MFHLGQNRLRHFRRTAIPLPVGAAVLPVQSVGVVGACKLPHGRMHRSQFCGIGGARRRARRCSLARALGGGGRTILENRRSDMCFELGAQRMHRSQFAKSARRFSRLEVLGGARSLSRARGGAGSAGKRSQHPNSSGSGFVYHPGSMKNSILWYTTSSIHVVFF